jgi:hypothetical protein
MKIMNVSLIDGHIDRDAKQITCEDCEWEKSCVFSVIDPKELCYRFRPKISEVEE